MSVDYEGECLPPFCAANDECPAAAYCQFEACDATSGACVTRPEICPDVWAPVCGCDGVTYGNACEAAMGGVSVDYEGACRPAACWDNAMCAVDEYCFFEVCAQETGQCVLRPEACPDLWDPVCGCDGQTYSNACYAAQAGVSVDYPGVCFASLCSANDECPENMYCLVEPCEATTGSCEFLPGACDDLWEPVCGCDGQTYANDCNAAMAGVSVDFPGPCDVSIGR